MNFITIEHKDGAMTLNPVHIESIRHERNKKGDNLDSYEVWFVESSRYIPLELTKEQYDKLVAMFTY